VHPVPFAFGSFIGEWGSTLGKLAELDARTIVPGHGEVQHDMRRKGRSRTRTRTDALVT
jgi:glyoxylase-like metal-dependent hydrolase (beta-lactamase superfamily II)